jgi:hypothetical protein
MVGFKDATPPLNTIVLRLPSSTVPVLATQSCAELVPTIARKNTSDSTMRCRNVCECPALFMVYPRRYDAGRQIEVGCCKCKDL